MKLQIQDVVWYDYQVTYYCELFSDKVIMVMAHYGTVSISRPLLNVAL